MMEDNFRNMLIIISAIVIGAIFVHGLWTIRKNKNPYKLDAKQDDIESPETKAGHSGFDQDGIGQVKVVQKKATELSSTENISIDPEPITDDIEQTMPETRRDISLDNDIEPSLGAIDNVELTPEIKEPETVVDDSVYQAPVIQPKKTIAQTPKKKAANLKRNQMELSFGDETLVDEPAPSISNEPSESKDDNGTLEPEIMVLSVVMPEGQIISGAALLPSLLTLGMKYGEMNIFHRHQDNAGNGKVTFSLANMMNPGTFDLDAMESFVTQGISLFMTLPNAGDPFEVFQQMLGAAKQLAQEHHGQVLDDKRSVMTKQTEQHYISKIREYERKKRIANA